MVDLVYSDYNRCFTNSLGPLKMLLDARCYATKRKGDDVRYDKEREVR